MDIEFFVEVDEMDAKSLISRVTERMDMPSAPLQWMPLVEIAGNCRVLIEKHRGIAEYSEEHIVVRVHNGSIRIEGKELRISQMDAAKLIVCGLIRGVLLHGKGGKDEA